MDYKITPERSGKKKLFGLPTRLEVAGLRFPIIPCKQIRVESPDGSGFAKGAYMRLNGEILIDQDLSPQFQNEVLLHEALHAIDDVYGLDLSEEQVRVLGVALNHLIRANPVIRRNPHECTYKSNRIPSAGSTR